MRAVLVFAPIVALAVFVTARSLVGRPLSRRALDVAVALMLLGYLAVTAGLGLFWVARMDLPVFDWHYLFGYALLVVAAAHVSLQVRGLLRFFRPRARTESPASGPRATPGSLAALTGVALLLAGAALFFGSPRSTIPPSPPASDAGAPPAEAVEVVRRLYDESSYSREGVLRALSLAPERPSDTKPYPGRTRHRLPEPARRSGKTLAAALDVVGSKPLGVTSALTLDTLSTLLFHAYGVTKSGPGYRLRAAASSGALYPTDLYVVSASVSALPPGAHYYDGPAHELVTVGGAGLVARVREALPELPGLAEAPLLFVFGSTFDRTAWKYTVRSYRYLGLDAGHVAENLLAAAAALGVGCEAIAVFDDARLGAALELEPRHEAALLVLACGGPNLRIRPAISPRHESAPWPDDADRIELTRLSSAVTSWSLAPGFHWLRSIPAPRARGALALVPPERSDAELFDVIRSRRSFREFDAGPVAQSALSSVLADAHSVVGWLRGTALVELYVGIRAVSGVEPGTYRYDAEARALSAPIARGAPAIESAGLDQALLGRAAFVLAWALIDERVGRVEGARDFRHACLEAGLAGEMAYLSASARGLGICGVGAFYDEEVNALFSQGGRSPRMLYLQGVGGR